MSSFTRAPHVPAACPACGRPAAPDASFCPGCGVPLAAPAPAETRKQVTVLFCDLAGSTALGERLDPEALRLVQMRYFAACQRALTRHGGTVEKYIGDAVMCVFGVPAAREDDALRACRAALDLVAGVAELNDALAAEWGVRLLVRTGVNTGAVVAGDPRAGQAVVTGDAVNTAARLEQAAGAGQVLIGPLTRQLVGAAALCEPLPPLSLKGKAERLAAWRLVALDDGAAGAPAAVAPMVGRQAERKRLEAWLAAAAQGAPGGLCLVVGAPGMGKSRLLGALAEAAPGRVLWGRCPPYGEGITYWPLADWLQALGAQELARRVSERQAAWLRFAAGGEGEPAGAAEIAGAARALGAALAAESPLLLVAEDLQWAEPTMLDLLGELAGVPGVAVAGAARPEVADARPGLAGGVGDLRLRLAPLGSEPAAELLDRLAPSLPAPERARLLAAAEGSPLALAQLARHLAEGGDPEALPPGLEAVLQARVERLSPEERSVAERAAVMGREFWDDGLAALAPEAPPPAAALAALVRRELVGPGRADGAPARPAPSLSRVFAEDAVPYSFTSALVRDAVYQAAPKLRRADLHEALGGLLEEAGAPDEVLAFHLERAARLRAELRPAEGRALAARAAERLERAGERALARQDGVAARALLTRAAALVDDADARARLEASIVAAGPAAGAELVAGDVVGGYRVVGLAGRGGMGVVYRAEDLALGRQVALKVIAPALARDPRFRERFARESRIAAGLEHPHVVPVYRAGEEQGRLYIAMRYVEGRDLQDLVRSGPLTPARAAALVAQVAQALDAAHARGLVHRDVKPANVLLTGAGAAERAYLSDFGLSLQQGGPDGGLTRTGQWVGTLAYVAPEQIRADPVDARADVYALGAVLYQCLTGRLPFPVESELEALGAHLDEPPPRPSVHGAPAAFDRVIARAMAKDPARRYRAAGDLGRAGVAAAAGTRARLTETSVATGAAAPVAGARRPAARARRPTLIAALGGGGALAAAGVVAALVLGGGGAPAGPVNPAGHIVGDPIALPIAADHLAAGGGQVWALAGVGGDRARLDVASGRLTTFPPAIDVGGGEFRDIAVGEGGVWIAHFAGIVGGINHVDPASGEAVQRIQVPYVQHVATGGGAVWALRSGGTLQSGANTIRSDLYRIDPATDRLVGRARKMSRGVSALAVGADAVWVANASTDSVLRIDPASRTVRARIPVGDRPSVVSVGAGRVWVANLGDHTITRIDPRTNQVEGAPLALGKELDDVLATDAGAWVAAADGTVTRLDPADGQPVGQPMFVAPAPLTLAADGASVWVASASERTLTRLEAGRG